MFANRLQAGELLAEKLRSYSRQDAIVLAIPRGGVPVAYSVAKRLSLPLDITLAKKVGHPMNREYAIGAVSLTEHFINPHEQVTQSYIDEEVAAVRKNLRDMYTRYMGDRTPEPLKGKILIVVDDGIATGNTLLATVHMLRRSEPARIVVAAPVASRSSVELLSKVADEVVVVMSPPSFRGVGEFYEEFGQTSDKEVVYYLDKWKKEMPGDEH